MAGSYSDAAFAALTFARAGIARPSRPDRLVRAIAALERYGPTLAAGYRSCAARWPDTLAIIDERGTLTFAVLEIAVPEIPLIKPVAL